MNNIFFYNHDILAKTSINVLCDSIITTQDQFKCLFSTKDILFEKHKGVPVVQNAISYFLHDLKKEGLEKQITIKKREIELQINKKTKEIAEIAALAYFGVLDPARLLPERCQSSAGMDCIDKAAVSTSGVVIALRNNEGFTTEITDASGAVCSGNSGGVAGTSGTITTAGSYVAFNTTNNEVFTVQVDCTLTSGEKFEDTITVTYKNTETGLSHEVPVDVRGRIA